MRRSSEPAGGLIEESGITDTFPTVMVPLDGKFGGWLSEPLSGVPKKRVDVHCNHYRVGAVRGVFAFLDQLGVEPR